MFPNPFSQHVRLLEIWEGKKRQRRRGGFQKVKIILTAGRKKKGGIIWQIHGTENMVVAMNLFHATISGKGRGDALGLLQFGIKIKASLCF